MKWWMTLGHANMSEEKLWSNVKAGATWKQLTLTAYERVLNNPQNVLPKLWDFAFIRRLWLLAFKTDHESRNEN